MRELTTEEVIDISGGTDFFTAFAMGSVIGATGYGGLTLAAGYPTAVVTAATTSGWAIGGLLGVTAYTAYTGATMAGAGTLGSAIGSGLATLSGAGAD